MRREDKCPNCLGRRTVPFRTDSPKADDWCPACGGTGARETPTPPASVLDEAERLLADVPDAIAYNDAWSPRHFDGMPAACYALGVAALRLVRALVAEVREERRCHRVASEEACAALAKADAERKAKDRAEHRERLALEDGSAAHHAREQAVRERDAALARAEKASATIAMYRDRLDRAGQERDRLRAEIEAHREVRANGGIAHYDDQALWAALDTPQPAAPAEGA